MLRLKANKTSLYKLVAGYADLPPMRRAQFIKVPREPDYWLEWVDGGGLWCKAFLSTCMGRPLLSITKKECGGPEVSRVVHTMDLADLQGRGMVERFETAAERRRAAHGA